MCRLKIFVPVMVLGMVILIPINVGAGSLAGTGTSNANANASTKFLFSNIDKLSMSNVPNGSTRWLAAPRTSPCWFPTVLKVMLWLLQ